jgi:hypothetical protein
LIGGTVLRTKAWFISSCLSLLLASGSALKPPGSSLGKFPFPASICGWKATGGVLRFDARTIFDYIDGGAEVYRAYGFRELAVRRYTREGQPSITAELFDMGTAQDAYGVFTFEREGGSVGVGQDSEFEGGMLRFWSGRYFVAVSVEHESPSAHAAVIALASEIARRTGSPGTRPSLLSLLPQEHLDTLSVRYFHEPFCLAYHHYLSDENILRLGRSTNAVLARYAADHRVGVRLLLVEHPDTIAATAALQSYQKAFPTTQNGAPGVPSTTIGEARREGRLLILVRDAPDAAAAQSLIEAVRQRLREGTE